MSTAHLTHHDLMVRNDVLRQLEWDSHVDASDIAVSAHEGAVTLTGFVDTCGDKLEAERAAKRAEGVRAVANDIQVKVRMGRTDADIATDIARVFELRAPLIPRTVQATVHHGHVTLTGYVPSKLQRRVAERMIRHVAGIKHVANRIAVA
jgi:osmotically-inducible protein OsmY